MKFHKLQSARGALVCSLICAAAGNYSAAEEPPAKEPTALRELMDAAVNEVRIYRSADANEPARPLVVLRWANNARGSEDGTTLLYVDHGRPLAVECLYPWDGNVRESEAN